MFEWLILFAVMFAITALVYVLEEDANARWRHRQDMKRNSRLRT